MPAFAAWLLDGTDGRLPADVAELEASVDVVGWLATRRLACEIAAVPRLELSGLSRGVRRGLALEREKCGEAARPKREVARACGEALAKAGIAALLYKGAAVIELTHGDASRRPMTDLDLRERHDLDKAHGRREP